MCHVSFVSKVNYLDPWGALSPFRATLFCISQFWSLAMACSLSQKLQEYWLVLYCHHGGTAGISRYLQSCCSLKSQFSKNESEQVNFTLYYLRNIRFKFIYNSSKPMRARPAIWKEGFEGVERIGMCAWINLNMKSSPKIPMVKAWHPNVVMFRSGA